MTKGSIGLAGKPFTHLILLAIACIITYSNSIVVPFTFDDYAYLLDNPLIKDPAVFTDHSLLNEYHLNVDLKYNFILRPLAYLTFTVNYLFNGFNPTGFHLVNILIHTINSLLVYLLARQLLGAIGGKNAHGLPDRSLTFISFFSSTIFALHPLQTQAVTYIIQRFTSLATLFFLLTVVLYLFFRASSRTNLKWASYVGALLTAICAMKTKEIAFTLPLVLLMAELVYITGEHRRLLGLVPFLCTMCIIPRTVIMLSNQTHASAIATFEKGVNLVNFNGVSRWDYAVTQVRVVVTYLRLLFLPIGQNLDHDYPLYHSLLQYPVLLSLILILVMMAVSVWCLRRSVRQDCSISLHLKTIFFGICWFFITIAVESSFIPLDDLMFEHRVYLPSIGMLLAAVTGLDLIRLKIADDTTTARVIQFAAPLLVVLVLAAATIHRNNVWENIWADAAKKSPGKARPFVNEGDHLVRIGRSGEALCWLKKGIERDPANLDAHLNLGIASCDVGLFADALAALNFVVTKKPDDIFAWHNLATVYARQGNFHMALETYRKCAALNPESVSTRQILDQATKDLELKNNR